MDYLQYIKDSPVTVFLNSCFKPYYKWITFNTLEGIQQGIKQLSAF